MFFRRQSKEKTIQHSAYSKYVSEKVIPNISNQSDVILDTAKKCLPKGIGQSIVQSSLARHGHSIIQMIALSIAIKMQNFLNREFEDIEYADCALLAQFIMRLPLRNYEESTDAIVSDWIKAFETDIQYLIFASDEIVEDLLETGNDRYLRYEQSSEAKMPSAYFLILAKILKQRQEGEREPYKMLDHIWTADINIIAELEAHWNDVEIMMNHWVDDVQKIQSLAHDNDLDIWEWW